MLRGGHLTRLSLPCAFSGFCWAAKSLSRDCAVSARDCASCRCLSSICAMSFGRPVSHSSMKSLIE